MAGSTSKKILVRRFDRETLSGFVNPHSYLGVGGVEILSTSGSFQTVPYTEIKAILFVRDFAAGSAAWERRQFASRPKIEGLWVELEFRDGEKMEALLTNDLLHIEPYGFTLTPPDTAVAQRIFVPKAALRSLQVLGVVGIRRRKKAEPAAKQRQLEIFE